jgi:hypothetical protein
MAQRAIAVISAVSFGLAACTANSEQAAFLSVCEDILKERLNAPSTYELIEVKNFRISDATLDQWMAWNYRKEEKKSYYENEGIDLDSPNLFANIKPAMRSLAVSLLENMREEVDEYNDGSFMYAEMSFSYDAANAFNTPLRDTSVCTFAFSADDGLIAALEKDDGMVFLDGETRLSWVFSNMPD